MQNEAVFFSQKALSGGISIAGSTKSKSESTSTIRSGRGAPVIPSSGAVPIPSTLSNNNDYQRISAHFPITSTTAPTPIVMPSGSSQRKRSWMAEGNSFVKEGISGKDSVAKRVHIDALMHQLHQQIEQVFLKGEKGKTVVNRLTILETFRNLGLEVFTLLAKVINLQEEKTAAQEQVAHLQLNYSGSATASSYLNALLQAPQIVSGKVSPPTVIPATLRHAPAERVVIFKSQQKGVQTTKEEQKIFRQDVKNVIGDELMNNVDVIRPTRNGGHTLIFQTAAAREEAVSIFRANERKAEPPIEEERSCIVAPKKKFAKVVCRDPPDDTTLASIINDMYGKRNVYDTL